ncbi:hypothetical protein [Nocardia sp. NPDC057030]|uniref:hypothetical protein n=1 Tax=unclassified Nocardia TaxID=2637762 RepID=UPI003624B91E
MSFDLLVLAMGDSADQEAARTLAKRCGSLGDHLEGHPDQRILRFYESLQSRFPDFPPYPAGSPWTSMPLDVGIDHLSMSLSYSPSSTPAIEVILELAAEHRLVVWDPQSEEATLPAAGL